MLFTGDLFVSFVISVFLEDKPDQTGSVEYKDRGIHKQMGEQCADDHAVGSQQESNVESKPADKSGVACH